MAQREWLTTLQELRAGRTFESIRKRTTGGITGRRIAAVFDGNPQYRKDLLAVAVALTDDTQLRADIMADFDNSANARSNHVSPVTVVDDIQPSWTAPATPPRRDTDMDLQLLITAVHQLTDAIRENTGAAIAMATAIAQPPAPRKRAAGTKKPPAEAGGSSTPTNT